MTIDRHLLTEKVSGQGEQAAWSLLPGMPGYEALSPPGPAGSADPVGQGGSTAGPGGL